MDGTHKVAIIVGTKEIEQQIAEYTEVGADRAPGIIYKKQGVFFKKQDIINLLTDVQEIYILGPEQSRDLAKFENIISPPYTFFLLNGDIELHRNRQLFVEKIL